MKTLVALIFSMALAWSSAAATKDSAAANLTMKVNGFFQTQYEYSSGNFNLPSSKVAITGTEGPHWSGCVELRPVSGNPLIKAYVDYRINPHLALRAGQFTNPFKWVELSPDARHIPFYTVYEDYVANGDDIGLAAFGKFHAWSYYVCAINGTGKNVQKDNNRSKDVTGYLTCRLPLASQAEFCWQYGQQPDSLRRGGFLRISGDPLATFHYEAAYTTRRDLHREGWYLIAAAGPSRIQLTTRLHRAIQEDPLGWTVGLQGKPAAHVKWQIATAVNNRAHPQTVALVQFIF
jgi:hypothetical protein